MEHRGYGPEPGFPDPRELFEQLKPNLRYIFFFLGLAITIALIYGSFFQVEPEEKAIVLRFGAPILDSGGQVKAFEPGLHFKIPYVDSVHKEAVGRQHRLEFGFRSTPGETSQVRTRGYEKESLMLTGDMSLIVVRYTVIYRISDLYTYIFEVKEQQETIRDVVQAVMRQLVGDYSMREVLTNFGPLQRKAHQQIQRTLQDIVPTGVEITEVAIKDPDVPPGAKEAFDRFNQTEPDVNAKLNEAKGLQEKAVGQAGESADIAIGRAKKEREEIVRNAQGEALAFKAQLDEYKEAPGITRQWMYLNTMQRVLGKMSEKIIIEDNIGGQGTLKLLNLSDLTGGGAK
jgi:membrane protease subunit HflK